ncbi:MAG: alpha/beta hydrolase [Pseudobacteriovorax sp.]|nr:alpha/beta hydrolase [Pseudobacteriovorax sp.]
MTIEEFRHSLSDSQLTIQLRTWGHPQGEPVLCLHGWLDNVGSYQPLSELGSQTHRFLAMDFLGHGRSHHLQGRFGYDLFTHCQTLYQLTRDLGIEQFHLVGHSMGGIVACLFAGAFSKRLKTLTMIESVGPVAKDEDGLASRFQKRVEARDVWLNRPTRSFAGLDEAAEKWAKVSGLGLDHARMIVSHHLLESPDGSYSWGYDPLLQLPSLYAFNEDQVKSFLSSVACPVLSIRADGGVFSHYHKKMEQRLSYFKDVTAVQMEGGHHLHMEMPDRIKSLLEEHLTRA